MNTTKSVLWDCRRAQAEIALQAGGDQVDAAAGELLEAHLLECPQCRDYRFQLADSLEALQACAEVSLPLTSLWSRVASRLPAAAPRSAYARFNLWVPTTAMAAACAAMVMVTVVQFGRATPWNVSPQPSRNLFTERSFVNQRGMHSLPAAAGARPVNWPAYEPAPRSTEREW